jgi:hypothetical protein
LVRLYPLNNQIMSDLLPYHSIPESPTTVNTQNTIARLVDGLAFRYRWATEGVLQENLNYRPAAGSMDLAELMHHVYDLAFSSDKKFGGLKIHDNSLKSLAVLRSLTLAHLAEMSSRLKAMDDEDFNQLIQNDRSKYSFWYWLNGPIADALTHVGQITSWRRILGNPQPKGVNVFTGSFDSGK